jgi:hypothetical protein
MFTKMLGAFFLIATSVPSQWLTTSFNPKPLPAAWVPPGTPRSSLTDAIALSDDCCPLDIGSFVARFGAPDRYLVAKKRNPGYNDLLVYDLKTITVLLYVDSPPETRLGAVAIDDKTGKNLRLIK